MDPRTQHRSKLYLARIALPPQTILEHLIARFPHVPEETWRERVQRGLVVREDGTPVMMDSPYEPGITIQYAKEMPDEPMPAAEELILFSDSHILVADKPHGMQVTPAGEQIERSLVLRLKRTTGIDTISPAHRLDRETAGLVLFILSPENRGRYQILFAQGMIEREYLAAAEVRTAPDARQWHIANRLEAGTPWFRRRVVEGEPNAVTDIELLSVSNGRGLFRLRPLTGKKHQLRVHMAALGFPIIGDPLYPEMREVAAGLPLQLLACSLSFTDPCSGADRRFFSSRSLQSGVDRLVRE